MDLYLIRHGEASTPRLDVRGIERLRLLDQYGSGSYDGSLTQKGQEQARAAAEFLVDRNITSIYTSPILRALQTSEICGERLGIEPILRAELKEATIGYLYPEEHTVTRLQMESALVVNDLFARITRRPFFMPVALYFLLLYMTRWLGGRTFDAEPPEAVRRRILTFLDQLSTELPEDAAAALFTHGYLIYYLVNYVLDPGRRLLRIIERPYIRNASVTHIAGQAGRWKVCSYAVTGPAKGELGLGGS